MPLLSLALLLTSDPAHAVTPTEVQRAIGIVQTKGFVLPPQPVQVLDATRNPPVIRTVSMGGHALFTTSCQGHTDAVLSYQTSPSGDVQIIGIMAMVKDHLVIATDESLDGKPEQYAAADNVIIPSADLNRTFDEIMICALRM